MIVEPDFPDHWKTQLLIQLTADEAAPMLVIRLWAFCHLRKCCRFEDLGIEALAAICRWKKEPQELVRVLKTARFLEVEDDGTLVVHDWSEVNAALVRNWINGPKGGRPKTQTKPSANPSISDGLDGLDGRDKMDRKDKIDSVPTSSRRRKKVGAMFPDQQQDPLKSRMLSLNAIFDRQANTGWSEAEMRALEASGLGELEELDFIDAVETVRVFYKAEIPREMEKKFWRRTGLGQLLNNWGGELDRARMWSNERKRQSGGALGAL